jgi:hypothetical protein
MVFSITQCKQLLVLAFISIFICSATLVSASETVLFSDGFETNDFSAWNDVDQNWFTVNSAPGAHSGNIRAEARGNAISSNNSLVTTISTVDHELIVLSFWYRIDDSGFEVSESMTVDYSLNGADWNSIVQFEDGDETVGWVKWEGNLPAEVEGVPSLSIRFTMNAGAASDIFKLDDVEIVGALIDYDSDDDGVEDAYDVCADTTADSFPEFTDKKAKNLGGCGMGQSG